MPNTFQKCSYILAIILFTNLLSCSNNAKFDPNRPITAEEKRRDNIEKGRGASIKDIIGRGGKTNYEFSSSNPMWRASLETLDFLPLTTVDYSGGVIITDWYSESSSNESIKITIRFLSNEIRSDSLKIIVHKKKCSDNSNCIINLAKSNLIKDELRSTILRQASLFEKTNKEKK